MAKATIKRDINGNKIVSIKSDVPNKRGFSIQTNGNLPMCHKQELGFVFESHFHVDLWLEIKNYLGNHGTKKQKKFFGIA